MTLTLEVGFFYCAAKHFVLLTAQFSAIIEDGVWELFCVVF